MFMDIELDLKKRLQQKSLISARDCKVMHENIDT